ncbi:MAG TPA: ATP-binding cassette domain-containing protein [Thermoguttaceae bacterium]|nr:ATP-binding cassette domain-containing protein [Thermoguttaceae bacterium]
MNAIELRNVGVVRRGNAILSDVTLAVEGGTCCAILGPNGSGKSSLVALLAGYLWPSVGTVAVGGEVFGRVNLSRLRRRIGLIEPSRAPKFDPRTAVRDVAATGLFGTIMLPIHEDVADEQWHRVDAELDSVGLGAIIERAYGDLSSGEQMKTLLARALVANAKILLLDEPTVGLDMGSRAICIGVLDRLLDRPDPPTVVIVSHHLDELPRAVDKVVLLKAGVVVEQGAPDDVLTSVRLSELFDCRVEVFKNHGRFVAGVQADVF